MQRPPDERSWPAWHGLLGSFPGRWQTGWSGFTPASNTRGWCANDHPGAGGPFRRQWFADHYCDLRRRACARSAAASYLTSPAAPKSAENRTVSLGSLWRCSPITCWFC